MKKERFGMSREEVNLAWRSNKAIREAKKKAALTDLEIKERLKLTAEDLDRLDEITARPGRNAMTQLAALKLKMAATVEPAKAAVGVEQTVTVVVKALGPVGVGVVQGGVDAVEE